MRLNFRKNLFKAITLLIGIIVFHSLSADNILKICKYSVDPKTEFTVDIEAENTGTFVAFQADIPIPAGFEYVLNSAKLNSARISGHLLTASVITGDTLRLIGYSIANAAFTGNSGVLVSFNLRSGTVPGKYNLEIKKPLLGDSQSKNILTSTINGDVTVLGPNLKLSATSLDYGRVPLQTTAQKTVQISNDGNKDLIISSLQYDDPQFSSAETGNLIVDAGTSKTITVKFQPTAKGTSDKQLQISSNDPDQPSAKIDLKAIAYAVNEIRTGSINAPSSTTATLDFTISNMESFTGFQFDLSLPQSMTYEEGTVQLLRKVDHTVSISKINANTLRVLAWSGGNVNFTGTSGKILSLNFSLKGTAGSYSLNMSNVIIANAQGENILSASYNGNLQITSPDIDAATTLNFGDVSILSEGSKNLRIYNYGPDPLIITQLMFSNDYFKSPQAVPLTILRYGNIDLPLKFKKDSKGLTTGTMKIVSNDSDENPFTVQLSANAFAPNYLKIKAPLTVPGESKNLSVEIENEESFVAFQFDLKYPAGITPDLDRIQLSDRKQDQVFAVSALSPTSFRVLVYSPAQKEFSGKSGAVLTIPYKCETSMSYGTYNLEFSNAIISDVQSANILYSAVNGTVKVAAANKPPVANAGTDQQVNEGTVATLDGSASADPDNDALSYSWTAPSGIVLSSNSTSKPTFVAPEVTTSTDYTFKLIVNDGTVNSTEDQVIVTVKQVNKAPVANAGTDQSVNEGTLVTLDGTASSDQENSLLTYLWTAPAGITLSSTTTAKPTFTAPEVNLNTNYTFSLIVNDGTVNSSEDLVVVTVKQVNKPPVANAGTDQLVKAGSLVTLDGTASMDPDNNQLTYKWYAPEGITLSSAIISKPSFIAPTINIYVLKLIVNDGTTDSQEDLVTINVVPEPPGIPIASSGKDILQTSFTANWNASALAKGYKIDVATDNGFTLFVDGYKDKDVNSVTSYSITGLSANTSYFYRVRAYNDGGLSAYSNIIHVNTLINPPAAPTSSAATNIVQTSFIANWNSSDNAAGYRFDISTDINFSNLVQADKDLGNVTTYTITELNPNTSYYYRIRAYNSGGASGNSSTIKVTTLPNIPGTPSANNPTNISQTSLTLKWGLSVYATGYKLDIATNSSFTSFLPGYNDKDAGNVTSLNVTGLDAKTPYYYRIRGYNSAGTSGNSNIIAVTTLSNPPSAPLEFSGFSCHNIINLKWRKNTETDVSKYRIYGGTSANLKSLIDSVDNTDQNPIKNISGLLAAQKYYFSVTAVNFDGPESPMSAEFSETVDQGYVPSITSKWKDVLICYNVENEIKSYQWYKNDLPLSSATGQFYPSGKQPGDYKVETADNFGCKNFSNTIKLTGLNALSAYPNPATTNFTLKFIDETEGRVVVSLLNSKGIKVLEFQTEKIEGELLKEVPVSNLEAGIYVVQVLMNQRDSYTTKIIVVK